MPTRPEYHLKADELTIERMHDECVRLRDASGHVLFEMEPDDASEFLLKVLRALQPRSDSYTADAVRAFLDEQPKCGVITIRGASS